MTDEWVEWHRQYDDDAPLAGRLPVVRDQIRAALDDAPAGPIRVISMCAGDGRDLLGTLIDHPRAADVRGRLIDATPELVAAGRAEIARRGWTGLEFVLGDASMSDAYAGAVPADLLLICGVFGNISDRDVRRTIEHAPELSARGARVIWTRGRFEPDLTPRIREWFRGAGFTELAYVPIPRTTATVGAARWDGSERRFRPGVRLFRFLPLEERPSYHGTSEAAGPTRCADSSR